MARKVTLSQRLRYEFDKSMAAGPIALVGWLAVASALGILLTAAVLCVTHIAPEGGQPFNFPEAAWQALMRTIDSGDVENDQGWAFRGVTILVTIWGIFIVSSLIGLLSAGVQERLGELRKGRSIVLERGHTLILNWSASVFDIIQQLSVAASDTKQRRVIVVMAQNDKVEMEDAIAERLRAWSHVRVICRSGDPTNLEDLKIANVEDAKAVIVVSPEDGNPDARNIKTVMALTQAFNQSGKPPRIVAEFRDSANVEAVRAIGGDGVQAVMADDLISRIIVHSSRQPGLSAVYSDLLAYEGMEIYTEAKPALTGRTFKEALTTFETGALVGLSVNGKVTLNPPMETRIEAGALGIFIADTAAAIRPAKKPIQIDTAAIATGARANAHAERALILGWNRRGPAVASELSYFMSPNSVMTIVADSPNFAQSIADLSLENKSVRVEHVVADSSSRAVIRSLDARNCDHVIVLSCSGHMDAEFADTRTLVTLLHLRQTAPDVASRATIVSEILDVRNRALAQAALADDFVVSNRLVSLMLTQMSENESLLPIFTEILDEEGAEVYMRPVEQYVRIDHPVSFGTLVAAAAARDESAFGYRRARHTDANDGLLLNPLKSQLVTFAPGDTVVVMANGAATPAQP